MTPSGFLHTTVLTDRAFVSAYCSLEPLCLCLSASEPILYPVLATLYVPALKILPVILVVPSDHLTHIIRAFGISRIGTIVLTSALPVFDSIFTPLLMAYWSAFLINLCVSATLAFATPLATAATLSAH